MRKTILGHPILIGLIVVALLIASLVGVHYKVKAQDANAKEVSLTTDEQKLVTDLLDSMNKETAAVTARYQAQLDGLAHAFMLSHHIDAKDGWRYIAVDSGDPKANKPPDLSKGIKFVKQ